MKKFSSLFLFLFICSTSLFSKSDSLLTNHLSSFKINFYGFFRNDITYDSRENLSSVSELISFIPLEPHINALGEDLNAVSRTHFLCLSTRLGMNITGPELLKAKSSVKIEADFSSLSGTVSTVRLRQAYLNFQWNTHNLLIGQTWHPFSSCTMPDVRALNAGAPFNAFNRSPMLQYNYKDETLQLTAATIWQFQYASTGPSGISPNYMTWSKIPELFLGVQYHKKEWNIGIGAEYVYLSPRETAAFTLPDNTITTVRVHESLHTCNALIYFNYLKNAWSIKAKTIYGQNNSHLLQMTGFGVTEYHNDGSMSYAPLQTSSSWLSLAYTHNYKISLFGGYMKNLGSTQNFISTDEIYARGSKNIDQMFRVSPSFSYIWNNLEAGIEYELTGVKYGTSSLNGMVNQASLTLNNRINAVVIYNFKL